MNTQSQTVVLFNEKHIRRTWHNDEWWFSVVDVCGVLTESPDAGAYWRKLKQRLNAEGSEVVTFCHGLKLVAIDGKQRVTDCSNTESLLRIIQSIPSPKAEPFKHWLAKVGYERMQELADPAMSLDRARENWQKLGRSEKWIQQRMTGQETCNKLTDYWKEAGVTQPDEFALLTNIIHQEWTGLKVGEHKALKGLKSQNLRDHMSEAELIFTALAELSTRQIADSDEAKGVTENAQASKKGGAVAKNARLELEAKTGKSVVTANNTLLLVEVKGEDRDNTDSAMKMSLGKEWQAQANQLSRDTGLKYRYMMVFKDNAPEGAYTLSEAVNITSSL